MFTVREMMESGKDSVFISPLTAFGVDRGRLCSVRRGALALSWHISTIFTVTTNLDCTQNGISTKLFPSVFRRTNVVLKASQTSFAFVKNTLEYDEEEINTTR